MAGRPAIPAEVHKSRGTYRSHRHGERKDGSPGIPKAPKWLVDVYASENDRSAVRRIWRDYVAILAKARVLTADVGSALAQLCQVNMRYQQLTRDVAALGSPVYETKTAAGDTKWVTHPLVTQLQQVTRELRAQEQRFGLDPQSRSKVAKVEQVKEQSEWDSIDTPTSRPDSSTPKLAFLDQYRQASGQN